MIEATDLVAFIANRGDGVHVALIHMRPMTQEAATFLLNAANCTSKRITHYAYDNMAGGIGLPQGK